jgi:hypothetical protein
MRKEVKFRREGDRLVNAEPININPGEPLTIVVVLDDDQSWDDVDQVDMTPSPIWDPSNPVQQGNKYLGSDGGWHLSECLLVSHTTAGYHCTCRDDSPDWDRG